MNLTVGKPRGALRRLVAKVSVLAVLVGGMVALSAAAAGADAPGVDGTPNASASLNGDGTVTVTLSGAWSWSDKGTPQCDNGGRIVGWQVDWNDVNPGQPLGATGVDVGVGTSDPNNAFDNSVHFAGTEVAPIPCPSTWGPISHTYSLDQIEGKTVTPCVVLYDIRQNEFDKSGGGAHSLVAGDLDPNTRNTDNSVEDPDDVHQGVCVDVTVPVNPDVSVVKTGPTAAVVGQAFTYDITATNTGTVAADNVTITDQIPANVTFVSASAPCTFDQGTTTVTCNVGTLAVGGSATVEITVVPNSATPITNTAVVTPDDDTPQDNTSTWVIQDVTVSPDTTVKPVPAQPMFPG